MFTGMISVVVIAIKYLKQFKERCMRMTSIDICMYILLVCTVVPWLSGLWLSEHLIIQTVSSQVPQSKYLYQHYSFHWFTEILQIAKMATKHKRTV